MESIRHIVFINPVRRSYRTFDGFLLVILDEPVAAFMRLCGGCVVCLLLLGSILIRKVFCGEFDS
ncbi:MAG: hypothetical protein LBH13_03450, partial [Cellulomonadaceae bacterium]|nr:hypothetical protein [Cellulomonadaceae bacterium]